VVFDDCVRSGFANDPERFVRAAFSLLPPRIERHLLVEVNVVGQNKDLLHATVAVDGFSQDALDERANDKEHVAIEARHWIVEDDDTISVHAAC
jgi:hypothetical protein